MKAYNKKRKPKHSTVLHYRTRIFRSTYRVGTCKVSKTLFYKGHYIKRYTIPKLFIGEYT